VGRRPNYKRKADWKVPIFGTKNVEISSKTKEIFLRRFRRPRAARRLLLIILCAFMPRVFFSLSLPLSFVSLWLGSLYG